jgi:D-alanine-D-alanine ligase
MTYESPPSETEAVRFGEKEAAGAAAQRIAVLVDHYAEAHASGDSTAPAQSTQGIMDVLASLGYEPVELRLQEDKIRDWLQRLMDRDFALAFNLCETIGGSADGEFLAAGAVELLDIPMTGASATALLLCLHKDRCSAILRSNGVSVPDWIVVDGNHSLPHDFDGFPAIVKPAADDASNGVHSTSVVHSVPEALAAIEHVRQHWDKVVIQEFVAGREINLAIVGDSLLPAAEIDFSTLPEGSPPIVSFAAKWNPESTDFIGTVPVCPAPLPQGQAEELQRLAGRVWRLMGGSGYARVDIRLAADGTPYVIDINPNPDLSFDAGLARQARVAGWSYEELIARIVGDALARHESDDSAEAPWTILEAVTVVQGVA